MTRSRRVELPGLAAFDFAVHDRPDEFISREILESGRYEPFETEVFRLSIERGDVVVDAGANIGWYTVIGALCTGPQGRVFAFEPQRDNFELLAANVARNALAWARAEALALAERTGDALLHLSADNPGDHRLFADDEARPTQPVRTTTLDHYLHEHAAVADVLKLDTQGSELRILEGARGVLDRGRAGGTVILLEYWPFGWQSGGGKPGALADRLESLGGELFVIDERRESLHRVMPATLRDQERGQLNPAGKGFINLLRWPAGRAMPAALRARVSRA